MIVKPLVQSGNSKAILQAAGIDDNTLFAIIINPNGGITIQSIESPHTEIKKTAYNEAVKENYDLLKRLSKK